MLKNGRFRIVALAALAVYLWARAISREGTADVFSYAIAGILSGLALTWICWSFATVSFTRRTALASASVGLFVFTPLIAMLLTGSPGVLDSSAVVLATAAGCVAAMAGAVWGVAHLAKSAFTDWRDEKHGSNTMTLRQAHR
jgi:hypothetical protein